MNIHKCVEKGFVEYDNWRYLKNERLISPRDYTGGQIDMYKMTGKRILVLLGSYYLVSFSNMHILEYINSDSELRGISLIEKGRLPEYCKRCCGAGKFDWISNITGPNYFHSRYEFIRDKRVVLLYHKPNGKLSKNHVWAPTEVYEGELICDACLGTGIDFDNSYRVQSELKKGLVLYDIRYLLTK